MLLGALCLVAALGRAGQATPGDELQEAREAFLAGQFERSIGKLTALLYPSPRLAEASSLAEAHLLLGVSFFETKHPESAEREFEEALFHDGNLALPANVFSVEVIRFFDAFKAELDRKAEAAAENERLARKQQALNRAFQNLVVFEKRRYWVNFMPFGAGQFQNEQKKKGLAFFVGEVLSGGATVGIWGYQVIRYGYRGKVPRDEVDTVKKLQILQIGSGAVFYALVAWGIVDSLSNYEHAVKREADPSLLKDLEEIFDTETTSAPKLVPMVGPESRGASLLWEF